MDHVTRRLMPTWTEAAGGLWPWSPTRTRAQISGGVTFTLVSDLATFEALESEWSSLFVTSGRPHQVFQTFEWLAIWARIYLDRTTRLRVVVGRIDGRLVLAWPLVVQSRFGLRILSGMGHPLSQYSDALLAKDLPEAIADDAFDYVMGLPFDLFSLRRVRDDAAIAPLLRRRIGAPTNRQASPFVDLSGTPSIEAFEARFAGKLRASRRRRCRRLEERGSVTFASHGPSVDAAALVIEALGFKRDWARGHGIIAPALRDPRFETFFVTAALAGANAPALRVSALRCGGETLGIEISIACKGHLFGHVLAPHPGFASLGLGGILAERTITSALEQGFGSVDLLAPADAYKLEWTRTSVGIGDYFAPLSLFGWLYSRIWLRFGRDAVKTTAQRLRPGIAALTRRPKTRRED